MANFLDFLAGAGQGYAQAETRNIEGARLELDKRKTKLAEDKIRSDEHAEFAKNAQTELKTLADSLKGAIEMFPGGRDAALQNPRIAKLAEMALDAGKSLDEGSRKLYGKPAFPLGPASLISAALQASTAGEKGEAKGAEKTAEATKVLERAPTPEERARVANVQPPAEAQPPLMLKLQEARQAATDAGKPALASEIDNQIKALGASTTYDPRNPTQGRAGQVQGNISQQKDVLSNLSLLRDQLNTKSGSGVIGAVGAFKGFLNETVAQAVPGLFSEDRATFEQSAKATREAALRLVTSDDRFNAADRALVSELFPSTGMFESRQNAEIKVQVMTAMFARRLQSSLTELGVDQASIPTMKPEDIRGAYSKGLLAEKEAVKILETLFPEQFGKKAEPKKK